MVMKTTKIIQRKTTSVRKILDTCNKGLAYDHENMTVLKGKTVEEAYRLGLATVLESILHDSGNYAGYSFLDQTMEMVNGVNTVVVKNETRRKYSLSRTMREDAPKDS